MLEFFRHLFSTEGFVRRFHCGNISEELVWFHNIADGLIWLAYMAIPFALIRFLRIRKDIPFPGIFLLFGLFILGCGFTHFMEIVMSYWPAYRLSAMVKIITALASWGTVFALFPVGRKLLEL